MNIVTAFVSGINTHPSRDLSKYVSYGNAILSLDLPTTCFLERSVFLDHFSGRGEEPGRFSYLCKGGELDGQVREFEFVIRGNTRFVLFEKTDLFLWPFLGLATNFELHSGHPNKDTLEYVAVQCQKVEWVCIAMALDQSLSDDSGWREYAWLDFGVFHMYGGNLDRFSLAVYAWRNRVQKRILDQGESDQIRIAGCWDPHQNWLCDLYRDIYWVFAGSVFGGGRLAIESFGCRMRDMCLCILREKGTLMWEVNVWVKIYREIPALFSWYSSDHTPILLDGYH